VVLLAAKFCSQEGCIKACYAHPFPLIFCRFDRDWKKIEAFVGSKTVIQVKSTPYKYSRPFSVDLRCAIGVLL